MRHACTTLLVGITLLSIGVSLGCGSDTTGPAINTTTQQYWQLTLNHHAITMALTAPYDTITLVATPRTVTGIPIVDTGRTSYSIDLDYDDCGCQSVTVSPTGILTADSVDGAVEIYASHTIGNITLTDSAMVYINDISPVPVFTTFKLQPQPGDSAKREKTNSLKIEPQSEVVPVALDANDNPIQVNNYVLGSSNSNVLYIGLGYFTSQYFVVKPRSIGQATVYAEATIYGVRKTDSLLYTVTAPFAAEVAVEPYIPIGKSPIGIFIPGDDSIAAGGTVAWINAMNGQPVDVVFDTPTAAQSVDSVQYANGAIPFVGGTIISQQGGGNIPSWIAQTETTSTYQCGDTVCYQGKFIARARRFPIAGTYPYHSTLYGTTGVIHVLSQ